jgi:hypothetical protein
MTIKLKEEDKVCGGCRANKKIYISGKEVINSNMTR